MEKELQGHESTGTNVNKRVLSKNNVCHWYSHKKLGVLQHPLNPPFLPLFPTPLFKLKLLLLVATCDQSNAQVTVRESLCCVDRTEFYQPTSSDISFEKLHQELPLLVTLIRQALPTVIKVTSIRIINVKLKLYTSQCCQRCITF